MDSLFTDSLTRDIALTLLEKGVRIILLLVASYIAYIIIQRLIERLFDIRFVKLSKEQERRSTTLHSLVHSVIFVIFCFLVVIMILNELRVDTTSLLAGASIIGLAIGVGAQSLVKDFVAGFFIILEGQYSIGDFVTVKGYSGTVIDVNLRTTKICSPDKVIHTIPNGLIDIVSNYTKGMYVATIRIGVSQSADPDVVLSVLQEALGVVSQRSDVHEEGASVGGLVQMEGNSFIYEVSIPARRSDAYGVCTAYRYEAAKRLAAAHIAMARFVIETQMTKTIEEENSLSKEKKEEA